MNSFILYDSIYQQIFELPTSIGTLRFLVTWLGCWVCHVWVWLSHLCTKISNVWHHQVALTPAPSIFIAFCRTAKTMVPITYPPLLLCSRQIDPATQKRIKELNFDLKLSKSILMDQVRHFWVFQILSNFFSPYADDSLTDTRCLYIYHI